MMRPLLITGFLLLLCNLHVMAQQSEEVIGVSDFRSIDTRGNVHLIINQCDSTSTLAVQYNNLRQGDFKYKVRKGVLYLDVNSGLLDNQGFVRVVVTTPNLEQIKSQGATIECRTTIRGEFFEYSSQGSTNIAMLTVDVDRATINTAGKCDVMICGRADTISLDAKIGSRIDAFRLKTKAADAQSYDGSEVYICPSQTLKAKASTAGTIYYMGTPSVEPKVSLFGDVVLIERAKYKPLFTTTADSSSMVNVAKNERPNKEVDKGVEQTEPKSVEKPKEKPKERKAETKSAKKTKAQPTNGTNDGDFF